MPRVTLSEIREQLGYTGYDNAPRAARRPLIERAVARAQCEHLDAANAVADADDRPDDPCDDYEGELPW